MKYLFLTIFFLASFAVIACGQIVFPSPNQVEMQKGYLTLRKKISIYAEDTTTFYLSLFRTEVLHNASVKWTKKASKAEIHWMTDSSLPPEGYRINISPPLIKEDSLMQYKPCGNGLLVQQEFSPSPVLIFLILPVRNGVVFC
jgi:hypothetical protein